MQARCTLTFLLRTSVLPLFALALSHCNGGSGGKGGANTTSTTDSTSLGGSGGSGGSADSGGSGGSGTGGGGTGSGGDAGSSGGTWWLSSPVGSPPELLSEVGLYQDSGDLGSHHPRAVPYEPRHVLWTNGSEKQRFVVVPEGETIDTSEREAWQFPQGTLFFKTFSYPDDEQSDGLLPIETRMIRRTESGFEYYAYLWDEDRTDAELLDGVSPVRVEVESDGETFEHTVPARLDCRKCHESQPVTIIGFDELRLNSKLASSDSETQLEALADRGILSEAPSDPAVIEHDDPTTEAVLGYLHGNCAHCHNGWSGPSSAFDMRYPVALENLIAQETTSGLISGIRVVPGDPRESALVKAFSREGVDDAQPMPPLGVDLRDDAALALIEGWIADLEPLGAGGASGE